MAMDQRAICVSNGALASFRRSRALSPGIVTILLLACVLLPRQPQLQAAEPAKATNSKAAHDEAIRGIPFDKIEPTTRAKVQAVINDATIYRRMPVQTVDCDPELFLYLIQHPEVVVNMWENMGVSKMTMTPKAPGVYHCADGEGTQGELTYVYKNHDTQVIFSDGTYEGPLFGRKLRGQCVLVLKTAYVRETNGRFYITNRLDAFLHLDNIGLDLVAKTVQPMIGKVADYNFTETCGFVSSLSHTAETNPRGVEKLAHALKRVDRDTSDKFVNLVMDVRGRLDPQPEPETNQAANNAATRTSSTPRLPRQ